MSSAIDDVLNAAVASGAVPNVVAVAADRNGQIYEGSAGPRAVGGDDPVTADTMFRIASMTKIVCTTAALQLAERGAIDLDAPVENYCPAFAQLKVLDGFDGDTPRYREPASKATVRHLTSHTSGLSYWFWNEDLVKWEAATETPNVLTGLQGAFDAPLVADPGSRFEYGINTDWLGKVVESASGLSLDKYLAENVIGPLGMNTTTFLMSDEQRANSAPVHMKGEDGAWAATELDWSQTPDWWAGGHGLHSTPRDYLKMQQMLLGGGSLGEVKILEKSTVDEAFTNQIGELEFPASISTADPVSSCDFNIGPGWKFGHGLLLSTEQQPGMRSPGTGSWAGIFNTHFWVDREAGITGAIYSQFLPFVTPESMQLYADFETALYSSR